MDTRRKRLILIALSEAQNHRCAYCSLIMEMPIPDIHPTPATMTLEHVRPQSRRGCSNNWNLVAACWRCNNLRRDYNALRFHAVVQQLIAQPEIKACWHTFNRAQLTLLREEIIFGHIVEKAKKDPRMDFVLRRQVAKRTKHMKRLQPTARQ